MEITGHEPQKLRRELNIWEAIGISLALMAPSMAANINPQGTVGQVGRAVARPQRDPRLARDAARGRLVHAHRP